MVLKLHQARCAKAIAEPHTPVCIIVALAVGLFLGLSTAKSFASSPAVTATPIFATDTGDVRCATSGEHTSCLGIPFAAPPVGALRFKQPAPVSAWRGVRDATRFASACIQAHTEYVSEQHGSEDCLYLNVYIPSEASSRAPLPVMVWLHGGGFVNGSGNAFNGTYLAQTANAVVVTVNYRLGAFGWLALPSLAAEADDGSTGNYGLLDSIAALKWVQRSIANFGGDPQRVTLVGQSAGGEQTFALLASPYAKGLFQRAIVMSAPATLTMPAVEQAAARRAQYLTELGCTDLATQPECLRAARARQILGAARTSWDLIAQLGLQWTPTVDRAVLPDQWLKRFRAGEFNKMPTMVGHTREEGRLFVAIHENNRGAPMDIERVKERGRAFFGLAITPILLKYPPGNYPDPGNGMAEVITDALFAAGLHYHREALSRHVPVYGYRSCDPEAPESHVHAEYSNLGCAHDSDLSFLFQWDDHTSAVPDLTPEQRTLSIQMGRYWGNFAASGNPNGSDLPEWPPSVPGDDRVQLLEPASLGGVRSLSGDGYRSQHRLGFWGLLALLKHPARWIPWALIVAAILLIPWLLRRFRSLQTRTK